VRWSWPRGGDSLRRAWCHSARGRQMNNPVGWHPKVMSVPLEAEIKVHAVLTWLDVSFGCVI